jgi:Dolichyl-phosphate-mannose-protein mannosyltransferase
MKRPSRILAVFTSVWFIAAAALATRLAFTWDQQTKIPHAALAALPFDQEAGNIALALSQGRGYANLFRKDTGATAWLAPVYPSSLSLIFRFFGPLTLASFFVAVILNAFFSAAATFPLYAIARSSAGLPVAATSAWIWVFLPSGVMLPFEWIWDTSLSVLLAVTLVWATIRASESARSAVWLAYGLLWALALLTNPALGIALPFFFGWAFLRAGFWSRRAVLVPVVSLFLAFLCCIPWTIRNFQRFHRVIPIRSSLPFELWIGNNDIFDEHAVHGIQRITRFEETHRYAQLGETAYLDEKWRLASGFIKAKPALFATLTGRRIVSTWCGTEHPVDDFMRTDSLLVRVIFLVNFLLTIGSVAAVLGLLLKKHPLAIPLLVFPLLFPVVYYLTHTSLRYRHPVDPFLALLTVYSVASVYRGLRFSRNAAPVLPE